MWHQAGKCADVILAIGQDFALFFAAERRALQDAVAGGILARGIDLIFEEIAQRAGERIKAFLAVAALQRAVVGAVAEFDVGVERAGRLAPAPSDVEAKFGGEIVAVE